MANQERHAGWDAAVDTVNAGTVGDSISAARRVGRTGAQWASSTTDFPQAVEVLDVHTIRTFGLFGALVALLFDDN